jgi:3-hydroxymyristoyl/3-hydroxydecanoyl-(acyl carrier protein) dehydratase
MWLTQELQFPGDHPTAAGHFPGNPVVPGALLLDAVVAAIAGSRGVTIRATKFLQPVRPGECLRLRWQPLGGALFRYECRRAGDDVLAMSGMLETGAPTP